MWMILEKGFCTVVFVSSQDEVFGRYDVVTHLSTPVRSFSWTYVTCVDLCINTHA